MWYILLICQYFPVHDRVSNKLSFTDAYVFWGLD